MAPDESRIKQEQLRKRRNNLLRRHNDFWRLYSIKRWVIMEMPNGRLYTYYSHPHVAVPTKQEITQRPQPAVHKSPSDYDPHDSEAIPKLPAITVLGRCNELWTTLSQYITKVANYICEEIEMFPAKSICTEVIADIIDGKWSLRTLP